MARPRKYTKKALREAVAGYFDGITRLRTVTEPVWTGEKDEDGHKVFEQVPVYNQLGREVVVEEYIVPPSVGGLCAYLGIHRDTWHSWGEDETFREIVTEARERLQAWNEQQLLERPGKDLKGILFNLENNYGYAEKQSVQVTGSVEEYLRGLREQGRGQEM